MATEEKYIVFGQPHISEEEIEEVVSCLRSGWIGTGPRAARFEADFARYKGVDPACVAAVSSCTAALHLSLIASGVGPGDEVITTPMTFCATVNAIIHAGAVPVLADIDPCSMNIDPDAVRRAITPKTRALVPVHFAGRPCNMDDLMSIARDHGLKVIEDCAHAIETESRGRKTGTIGDFGCFSFYATKNITTAEGGMVICRSGEDASRIRTLALHGMTRDAWKRYSDEGYRHYLVVECGFKYNMTDLAASIGIHQLERVEENWTKRRRIWDSYMSGLKDLPVTLPAEITAGDRHSFHLFTILVGDGTGRERDLFLQQMHTMGIGTGVHYLSIAEHPYYQDRYGWHAEDWPVSMSVGRRTASLPLSPALSDDDVGRIIAAISAFG